MTVWTKEKISILKSYLQSGKSITNIAKDMHISYSSIEHATRRYGLEHFRTIDNNFVCSKIKKSDITMLASQIGQKVYDSFRVQYLQEPKAKKISGKIEEISILDISDVHIGMINEVYDTDIGKKIVTYNHAIYLQELNTLYKSIEQIHGILSNSYKLKKLVINIMGDIVTNDRIFPEQVFEIEKCVGLQVWDAISSFSEFFNKLLNFYEEIDIVCVVGNHGRSQFLYNEPVENNYEFFIYKSWEKQFENSKRIKVIVPNTRRFIHTIGNWKHLIEHGDQFRGCSDNSIKQQLKELYVNVGGFDVLHFGHFHELSEKTISDKVIVKQNGSWIYRDNYAWEKFKTFSIPKQHFFGCNSKRAETWGYKIDLRT